MHESETGLNPLLHAAGAAQAYVESKLAAAGLSLPKLMTLVSWHSKTPADRCRSGNWRPNCLA
jgi:hypothetical protein